MHSFSSLNNTFHMLSSGMLMENTAFTTPSLVEFCLLYFIRKKKASITRHFISYYYYHNNVCPTSQKV